MIKRPGDGHALLLTAGELGRPVVDPLAQADQGGQLATDRSCASAESRRFPGTSEEADILEHGVLSDQVVRLEDEAEVAAADLGEFVVIEPRDVASAEEVAGRWSGGRGSPGG